MTEAEITSPPDSGYNCIAWAAHNTTQWWEPDPMNVSYWPADVPREYTVNAYVKAFESLGYQTCEDNSEQEVGFDKIALYMNSQGIPQHASRQLPSGQWSSKLGADYDVKHPFFRVWDDLLLKPINLISPVATYWGYGMLVRILRRKCPNGAHRTPKQP